ncbi:MAG: hypothetical protein ABIN20_01095 [candidate division WOR-3 bacterium]
MNKIYKIKVIFFFFLYSVLHSEKILVLPWNSLGIDIEPTKNKVLTKLFAGEIAKLGKYQVIEGTEICEDVECAIEKGKEKDAQIVIFGSINALEFDKYFFDLKAVQVSNGEVFYFTQYPLESLENIDVAIKLLAKSFVLGKQAEEVALEEEGGWRRKARLAPSVKIGYNYFVGKNSYRKEHTEDIIKKTGEQFAEPQPQRAFNLDFVFTYFMTNVLTVDFDFRFEISYRGIQMIVPVNYFFYQSNFSPFVQGGVLFGFGPTKKESVHDFWSSERDGFGFVLGGGILFFRKYDFNLIFNSRYTIIFNKINDQGISFVFGILWAPTEKY